MDAAALTGNAALETTAAVAAVTVADVEDVLFTQFNIVKHDQINKYATVL